MFTLRNFTRQRFIHVWLVLLSLLLVAGCVDAPTYQEQMSTPIAQASVQLQLQPQQGWAGEYIQVTGSGWPANQLIMIHLEDDRGRSGFLSAASSDASGELATGFTWPISDRWLTPGSVRVVARGPDDQQAATAIFTVIRPGEEAPVPTALITEIPTATQAATDGTPPPTATAASATATATVTPTPGPVVQTEPIASEAVLAERLERVPVIDGDLGEWQSTQGYLTPFVVEQHPEWDGSMDVEAIWHMGWDDDALYFGVQVADDQIVQENTPQFAYFGDSLELELDTNIDADPGPTVNRDDFQFIISPGNFRDLPPAAYRFQGTNEGRLTDAPGTLTRVAAQRTQSGYTLEFAIPWQDINTNPLNVRTIGATLSTNDNDVPDSVRTQFLLLSNVAGRQWSTPNTWGRLTLAE